MLTKLRNDPETNHHNVKCQFYSVCLIFAAHQLILIKGENATAYPEIDQVLLERLALSSSMSALLVPTLDNVPAYSLLTGKF